MVEVEFDTKNLPKHKPHIYVGDDEMETLWIKYDEQKPKIGHRVLVWQDGGNVSDEAIYTAIFEEDYWLVDIADDCDNLLDVGEFSHWMPLPEKPKDVKC